MKIGRNDPCWCGSGIKYKKCHYNRHEAEPINRDLIFKQLNNFYDKKYCSVPDSFKHECTKEIVKAHSVSKRASLNDISHNGHVLTTFRSISLNDLNSKILPKKVGINRASTFTGFCSFHDKKLFSPIEDNIFIVSKYNCFLPAYRALAREIFVKERSSGTLDLIKELDRGKDIQSQILIQTNHRHYTNNNDLTLSDLKYIKLIFDQCLADNDYTPINHMIIHLNSPPDVMASAVVAPAFNFQGEKIQSFSNDPKKIPSYLVLNSFSSNGVGYIVLSWLKEHDTICTKFCDSLLKTEIPASNLICFIFSAIENIYISETWWDNLSEEYKNDLVDLFSQGVQKPIFSDALITNKLFNAFNIYTYSNIK